MSIINYFEKFLSWDLLVQGFFIFNICILIFLLLLYMFYGGRETFINFWIDEMQKKVVKFFSISVSDQNTKQDNDLISKFSKITQLLSLGSLIIIFSFISGVIVSEVGDSFMDRSDWVHLGFKKNWVDKDGMVDTDKFYKIQSFSKIFGKDALKDSLIVKHFPDETQGRESERSVLDSLRRSIIKQIYYTGKHDILGTDKWREYLSYSQNLVNLNQTFCFGSWMLLCASLIAVLVGLKTSQVFTIKFIPIYFVLLFITINVATNIFQYYSAILTLFLVGLLIFILAFIPFIDRKMKSALFFLTSSIIIYHATAESWLNCEKESNAKTFGLIIYHNEKLKKRYMDVLLGDVK